MSRLLNENTEWKLDSQIFQKILKLFSVKPEIDIFASHLNYQVPTLYHEILIRMHMQLMHIVYHEQI